jgi:mRNA-degrading endonuclease RelE of RelBE toxin-antitoxin system
MRFEVILVPSAEGDLEHYTKREQGIILDALRAFLGEDADRETRRKKRLRDNPLAPWELRVGEFRVFYEIAEHQLARVLAIGHKQHNDLFIRGERIDL